MLTRLQKWGNSQGIRIPKYILTQASFGEDDDVEVTAEEGRIVLTRIAMPGKKYDLRELFKDYDKEYKPGEELGISYGKEEL